MTLALLKHLTQEQYARMVAAYVIGFGINADDLQCPYIKPAQSATDIGVTISFNTVSTPSTMWQFVQNNAVACINPVNWSVNADEASFVFDNQALTATLDTISKFVVVKGFEERQPLGVKAPWPEGNLHHYDLLFYAPMIKQNTLLRAQRKSEICDF